MDEDRWTESGPNADDAQAIRECGTDEAAEVALTLRWSFEDLKAEHGEAGARRILAEVLARWQTNGGEPVAFDD